MNPSIGGIEMIGWLTVWLQDDNTKLMYLLCAILVANILDFTFGSINAKFNERVPFSSKKAKNGLFIKIGYFIILVYLIPVAMLLPTQIGVAALYTLYTAYLLIETNSLFAHFRLTKDDKRNDLFVDFIGRMFNTKSSEKREEQLELEKKKEDKSS